MFGRPGLPLPSPRVLRRPQFKNNTGTPGLMVRIFPSKLKMASWTRHAARTCSYVAVLMGALAYVIPASQAFAQAGFMSRDPNVSIDMSVLEELGPPATVAGQFLSSGRAATPPLSFPPTTAPVSRLTGPLALQRFRLDQPPRRQVSAPPRRTAAQPPPAVARPPAPVAAAPVAPQRLTPAPVTRAPAQVEVPSARPATPEPPTPVPPAPTVATVDPAPAPKAAPKEQVDVAPPPPPPTTTAAAQPAPVPPEETEPPEPKPVAASTPPLTPSPIGAGPTPPVQTSSTTNVGGLEPSFRVLFDDRSAKISDTARAPLEELSNAMKENENLRVQLLAYASGTSETASQARRLSLSRALAVRSYMINPGVRSTRMDVRALGNKAESGPADRVDAVLVER